MICPKCGSAIPDGRNVCISCGQTVDIPSYSSTPEQKSNATNQSEGKFTNTRKGVITFQVLAVLIYMGLIAFAVIGYNKADNWITADSYMEVGIYNGIIMGITIISIITASFKLMKITTGICIVAVLMSIINPFIIITGIAGIFLIIAIIFAILANKRNKQLKAQMV